MKSYIVSFCLMLLVSGCVMSTEQKMNQKVDQLVGQMTLDEKLDMIHGEGFNIAPVERLGIPAINMSDASMGLRITPHPAAKGLEPSTAFPASILLAATWNPQQASRYATAVAEEFRARNIHVLLGPGINIYRHPLCGRNYEYLGEDPYLAAHMVVPYIKAVKKVGVLPVAKHFVANNSETQRKNSNTVVSERALREIYFPAFKAAVQEARTPGIMNAYNLLNGTYCGENSWLLKEVLRNEWGFDGMVISDWTSIWNSEWAANSGVDIEMPGGKQTHALAPEDIKRMLANGSVTEAEIDSKVKNLVRPCLQMGLYDANYAKPSLNRREAHAAVALGTAREGIVLLKNDEAFLPLNPAKDKKIIVIGPTAKRTPTTGGGSGGVTPENPISIVDAVRTIYPSAQLLEEFDEAAIAGADVVIVCAGLNDKQILMSYNGAGSIAEEQATFNKRKKGLVIEGEGRDRSTFSLPAEQNTLVCDCAEANPNTVVMITAGGGIDMLPWIESVKSVLWLFYPGENGCQAAAEIVAGQVNPSGKLPMSIERRIENNAANKNFSLSWDMKTPPKKAGVRDYWDVNYDEGVFVGYRHLDAENIAPLFCFGHGLSFTTFSYSDLKVHQANGGDVTVSLVVKNSGSRDGKETVQLYVGDAESSVPRPPKELKGFKKIQLAAGESKPVTFELDRAAFSFWSPEKKAWTFEAGEFDLFIGSSSRDIRLNRRMNLDSVN